jgi:hypothetical protein
MEELKDAFALFGTGGDERPHAFAESHAGSVVRNFILRFPGAKQNGARKPRSLINLVLAEKKSQTMMPLKSFPRNSLRT